MAAKISKHLDDLMPVHRQSLVDYLPIVRGNLQACAGVVEKRLVLLFLFIFCFEVLTRSAATEASIMGVTFSKLDLVEKIVPIAIGYMFYALINVMAYRRLLEELHDGIVKRTEPELYKRDLESYGHPPTMFHVEHILKLHAGKKAKLFLNVIETIPQFCIVVGPAIYIGYAIFRTDQKYGLLDPLVMASAIASAVFLILAFMIVAGIDGITDG